MKVVPLTPLHESSLMFPASLLQLGVCLTFRGVWFLRKSGCIISQAFEVGNTRAALALSAVTLFLTLYHGLLTAGLVGIVRREGRIPEKVWRDEVEV
jgi:hypothetical protein